jgi:hypothetical protein
LNDPRAYKLYLTGVPVLDLAFASFEGETPIAIAISFRVDDRGVPVKPVEAVFRGQTKLLLGNTSRMVPASDTHRLPLWFAKFLKDPVDVIESLIQLEIDAAKQDGRKDVGPPISIVKITKSGGGWEPGHKGACP